MKNFFKIYTGDYSEEGYKSGINDAKSSKPKNGLGVKSAIHPLNYVWKFSNSYDSYNQNYAKGYLDGQRVNHDIYNSNQTKGDMMGLDTDIYENHLRMVGEVRQNLVALKRFMIEKKDDYLKQIKVARNAGFMGNIVSKLESKFNVFENKINDITAMLDKHDNYLDNQENNLRRLIAASQQD